MKKRILTLLCTAVLAISIAAPPALAAGGPFYPISVEEYTYGSFDELRINKVYQLSLSDDPSGIPTEDFERNGRRYFLLDMIKEDEVGVDTQDYTDTITQDSDTNDLSAVLKQLDPHREVTTEDGYTGLLALDYTSVTVEAKGYKTSTKSLSATRTYPNLSDADSSLIPKTITDGGRTLTLADVQWLEAGEFYNATASYTGTATSKYATGYVITAEYAGEVVKTISGEMIYTAVFSGTPINAPVQNEPGAEDNSTETQPPEPAEPGSSSGSGLKWLLILPIGAGAAGLAFLGKFLLKKYKAKKEWKEYTT